MNRYDLLAATPLLVGIDSRDFGALLDCVGAVERSYEKDEFISLSGDGINAIGVVVSGRVLVIKEDIFGNRAILNEVEAGGIFGESFICGEQYAQTVSVQAASDTTVLFFSFNRVLQTCDSACEFHSVLIKNMVRMLAQKNINLVEKLEVTTKHSLREKILTYLSQLSQRQQSTVVISPLGRIDLADLFGVDRSALTRELKKMQTEGLIVFEKNTFRILGI